MAIDDLSVIKVGGGSKAVEKYLNKQSRSIGKSELNASLQPEFASPEGLCRKPGFIPTDDYHDDDPELLPLIENNNYYHIV